MELTEAKEKFLTAWGVLGSNWGINRTMAMIHARLLISEKPMSAEDLMSDLQISRGNTNMNVRELIKWGLAEKVIKPGERKDFFQAEKEIWKIAQRVAEQRRKRELEPVLRILKEVKSVQGRSTEELKSFTKVVKEIDSFSRKADKILSRVAKAEESWYMNTLMKLLK